MVNRGWRAATLGLVLVSLSAVPSTGANEKPGNLSKTTYFTFNRPVALPGVGLDSGTYIFELVDPIGAWDLVRVSSRDRRTVYFTAFTKVVDRPQGMSPGSAISLAQAPTHSTHLITAWWPIGESAGRQFIYTDD